MHDNYALVHSLRQRGLLRISPQADILRTPAPLPATFDFDRIEGMLLGMAIGDSLGNTSEGLLPGDRASVCGEIRDYRPHPHAQGRRVGLPSDDTQMAFWTVEQLLADDGLVPEHLAEKFCSERIFGMGSTVRAFINDYKDGTPWEQAGQRSAGNGALMRIAPVLLTHLQQPSPALYADALLAGMVTHNDAASNACCVALVHLLWELLRLDSPPPAEWWVNTFFDVAQPIEGATHYQPRKVGADYSGPLTAFAREAVTDAWARNLQALAACNTFYSSAFLMETVPSVLYILMRHGHDPEEAIVRAVNDTVDNDTVAAIVGAAVGALHGKRNLPRRWLDELLGRTRSSDDGRVQALIEQARARWGR